MTAMQEDVAFLEHHGVKGMKWGQRKERRLEKKDAKWSKKQKTFKTVIQVNNTAAVRANADIPGINAKYAGKDLTKDNATTRKYYKEIEDNWNQHVDRAASELGVSPSGKKKLSVKIDMYTKDFVVDTVDIIHADQQVKVSIVRDASGMITEFKVEDPIEHSGGFIESDSGVTLLQEDIDFLEHHGVKGMKWGQRKAASISRNHRLNKASRAKDKKAHANEVQAARDYVNSGKARENLKKAKKGYKADKIRVGSREAKKILAEKRAKEYEIIDKSQEAKNGKEVATRLLVEVAAAYLDGSTSR